MRIRWRLTWYGIGLTGLALLGFLLLVVLLAQATAGEDQNALLSSIADDAAHTLSAADHDVLAVGVPPFAPDTDTSDQPVTTVYDDLGMVLFATGTVGGHTLSLPDIVVAEARDAGASAITIDEVRSQVRSWEDAIGGSGIVAASQTTRVVEAQLEGARGFLTAFAFIALLAAAIGAWFMAGRALRPLRELASTTDDIGTTGDLTRRLPKAEQDDEVGNLAVSFNAMLDSLEEARRERDLTIEGQKQFVADASHELRSPLTSIATNAGFLLDHKDADPDDINEATRDIATSAADMGILIDRLIGLARSDTNRPIRLVPVDLRSVIEGAIDDPSHTTPLDVVSSLEGAVIVDGDVEELAQLVWILIDNAGRHGASAMTINVEVADGIRVLFDDDGPGVAPEHRSAIFDRFYRADPARSGPGYGLGLAIASTIVDQHGGTITVSEAPTGGARFTVEFPTLS